MSHNSDTNEKKSPRSVGKRALKSLTDRLLGFFSRLVYILRLVFEASPGMLLAMCFLCVVDGVLPVFGAYITKDIINAVAELIAGDTAVNTETLFGILSALSPVVILLGVEVVYLFIKRVLGRINTMVTSIAGELVVNHIKLKILTKVKTLDQGSFDDPLFYEKLDNANREAGMRPIHILSATFKVISAAISVSSFIVVLATMSPLAPVVIIVASIPGAIVNYHYRHKNFRYLRRHSKERRQMTYYSGLMTNKDNVKEIKMLGLADTLTEKYKDAFSRYYKGLKRIIVKECLMHVLISGVFVVASGALFAFVAYRVVFHGGEIGDWSLYTGALNSITGYVSTLVTATATIYEGTLFIDNMLDFMKEPAKVVPTVENPLIPERGVSHELEFKNVSFSYPGTERYVIKNVNLKFKSNESVVLVGLNGAGKSTLLKLIMRLYDPTEGVILLDGRDIREYDVESLYDMYGIIFQDFGRYAETVSENIAFGNVRSEHSSDDILRAAKRANADEFITALPGGYDTHLTRLFEDDGIEPSMGQWQKLAIARAFYKDSDILIMDEPTASLDPLAEQEVFNRFEELSRGKLSIFVSHRLSGAIRAGKIVVVSDGRIAESGTHGELMSLGGIYYHLFTTQAERYVENVSTDAAHFN